MRKFCLALAAVSACAWCSAARAQYSSDFEAPTYHASASGDFLSGQDGWYLPSAGGRDHKVYLYGQDDLNAPGPIRTNPLGGAQFCSGNSAGATFARAQHTGVCEGDIVTYSVDVLVALPTSLAQNLFSLSTSNNDTTSGFILLGRWEAGADAVAGTWRVGLVKYDASGAESAQADIDSGLTCPGDPWTSLRRNRWYRFTVTVNYAVNRIVSCSIRNITDNLGPRIAWPRDWYLRGGDLRTTGSRVLAKPTGARMFCGGSSNVICWDNFSITNSGTNQVLTGDFNTNGRIDAGDVGTFTTGLITSGQFAPFPPFTPQQYQGIRHLADVNGDGQTDGDDFQPFVDEALAASIPTGACCLPTGGCISTNARHCEALSGTYNGNGSACAGAGCAPGGSCTFSNNTCRILTQAICATGTSGSYHGDGSTCPTCDLTSEGACCLPDGSCIPSTASDCNLASAATFNAGIACANAGCTAAPRGACCIWTDCIFVRSDQCANESGFYRGDGTDCAGNPCFVAPPPNDECSGAIDIGCDTNPYVTWDNFGDTENPNEDPNDTACGEFFRTRWFRFTVPTSGSVEIRTCDSRPPLDHMIAVLRPNNPNNPCAGFTAIACNDDGCQGVGDCQTPPNPPNVGAGCGSILDLSAPDIVPGETLYLVVGLFSAAPTNQGNTILIITCP